MLKSIETIIKVVNLEIQKRFENKAIIGGLIKFLPTWTPDAISENVPSELREQIESSFSAYASLSIEERETSMRSILASIRSLNSSANNEVDKAITAPPPNRRIPVNTITQEVPTPASADITPSGSMPSLGKHSIAHDEKGLGLFAPVTIIPGIGDKKTELLSSIGINQIKDLFYFFPRRYDDYSQLKPINRIEYGEELTIIATVQSLLSTPIRKRNQARVEVVVSDGTGFLRLIFFRAMKYISSFENHFRRGTQLVISGKVSLYLGRKQMNDPSFELLDQAHLNTNGIIPVYPLISGLTQKDVRSSVSQAINFYANRIVDYLPVSIKRAANVIDLPVAMHQIHYPNTMDLLRSARDRLAFDEIFFLQLGVQQQKRNWHSVDAQKYQISDEQLSNIKSHLPFGLTLSQNKVISEILADLNSGFPMNRLIQGDVGSGKTIVSAIAALTVMLSDGQVGFMAPTSILAEQHFQSLCSILTKTDNNNLPLETGTIRLLTGDTPALEREEINKGLLDKSIKLLIGTHALLEDPIQFKQLQLAIIDEQHRFGVSQRAALRSKGENPHLLVMSATPIPRSLALTLFGDLDISIIDELPVGRKPVETQIIHPINRERAYQLIRGQIEMDHQAFIVFSLIDKGDNEDQKAAVEEHEYLQSEVFPDLKVGLLHGRMSITEKDTVMRKFREKEFDILVSTTVIEVGVDIPNATVMLIEGANRFGLAQLHQLRGRVGRGGDSAYCLLIPENEDALENERLAVMIETNDGFVLAEKDLEQRGPGDFIGYRQSGLADLRMASITDIKLIEKARHFAEEVFNDDPFLEKPENDLLSKQLFEFWTTNNSDIS